MKKSTERKLKKAFRVLFEFARIIALYFLLVVFVHYNAPWRANAWVVTAVLYVPIVLVIYLFPFSKKNKKK